MFEAFLSVFNLIITQISKKTGMSPRAVSCILAYFLALIVESIKVIKTGNFTVGSFVNFTFLGTTVWTSATGYFTLFVKEREKLEKGLN